MTRHDKCRTACAKAMAVLRKRCGGKVEMTVYMGLRGGRVDVRNVYGPIWSGKACCRWRARAKAAKVLAGRGNLRPDDPGWCVGERQG